MLSLFLYCDDTARAVAYESVLIARDIWRLLLRHDMACTDTRNRPIGVSLYKNQPAALAAYKRYNDGVRLVYSEVEGALSSWGIPYWF
jgi:hypothetical protein